MHQYFVVGYSMMIEAVISDVIVGQKIAPALLVLLPRVDGIVGRLPPSSLLCYSLSQRVVPGRERDGQRQRRARREREGKYAHPQVKGKNQIGRASCRESGEIWVGAASVGKETH